jgi:hypothetical protein
MIIVRGQSLGQMKQEEVKQFIEWAGIAQQRTTFDLNIIGYPRCAMLITENGNGPIAYLPTQTVLVAECFIPDPNSGNRERVASLKLFDEALAKIAKSMNVGDVYIYVPFPELAYCNQLKRKGWTEIPDVRLFKKPTGVSVAEVKS